MLGRGTPPTRPPRREGEQERGRAPWWRRHLLLSGTGVVTVVLVCLVAPSLVPALTHPGSDSTGARLAEWARTHGLSRVVDLAERVQYDLSPPRVGGTPKAGLPSDPTAGAPTNAANSHHPRLGQLALPPPVRPFVTKPLAGEGRWHVRASVGGVPAIADAFLRPDDVHTSYVSGLVWMNPRVLRFALHPGYADPGASGWGAPDRILPGARARMLAAFNSGFRLYASRGGYYAGGRSAAPLRTGAASFVIDKNGAATVGQWGRDVRMSGDVVAVRQNLDLIVDHGHPVTGLSSNVQSRWGATLGNAYYVWRSGVGITRNGGVVYAAGNSLSVASLARLLARAGCVRAMELDINPEWTNFAFLGSGTHHGGAHPRNLLPDMQQSPGRYFLPMSRDFFTVELPPGRRP